MNMPLHILMTYIHQHMLTSQGGATIILNCRPCGQPPKKSDLAVQRQKYLGYTLGNMEIKPLIDKARTISAVPKTKTKKQLTFFLGQASYYCQLIPCFSSVTAPLTNKLCTQSPGWYSRPPACTKAFGEIKRMLCMSIPDFEHQFIIQMDASERDHRAVHLQNSEDGEYPTMYMSWVYE